MHAYHNGVVRSSTTGERTRIMIERMVQHGQWTVVTKEGNDGKGQGVHIYNLGPAGKRLFEVAMLKNHYGDVQPFIVADPDLAFDAPDNLLYFDAKGDVVKPDQPISGIICQDGPRGSLTSLNERGKPVTCNADGSIQVGEEKWWIASLFSKDKNRIVGYDAFCVRKQPQKVTIRELGDLNLFY